MKSSVVITALVLITVLALVASAPPKTGKREKNVEASFPAKAKRIKQTRVGKLIQTEDGIEDSYYVQFTDKVSLSAKKRGLKKKGRKLRSMKKVRGISIDKVTKSDLKKLEEDPDVLFCEQEQVYEVSACHCSEYYIGNFWNLDRLDNVTRSFDKTLKIDDVEQGDRPYVYVIDTGISDTHPSFMGKARQEFSAFTEADQQTDGHGHGTHVAGTISSHHFGVARDVKLRGVKVLTNAGFGSTSDIIAGITYVIGQHFSREQPRKSVINMSLGGGPSDAMNGAVQRAIDAGITVVVSAGNAGQNASSVSPANVPDAITVAASTPWDTLASYSNRGSIVDIIAPGSHIMSAYKVTCLTPPPAGEVPDWGHPCMKAQTLHGTSMAAPHVTGAIAAYMNTFDAEKSPAEIRQWLNSNAAINVIAGVPFPTPNKFLQVKKCS